MLLLDTDVFRLSAKRLPATVVIVTCLAAVPVRADDAELFYDRDIRPILAENCFRCHGPDENAREADLRLDRRDAATRDRGDYAAVSPGEPDRSALIERINSTDPDVMMPPPQLKKRLTAAERAKLLRWIEQGARYQGHWSWRAIRRVEPPAVRQVSWVRNEIDRFVLARLENASIQPAPEAPKSTLVRRLYIDLIGLLPPPEVVEQFTANADLGAYEQLVESLLASEHYGERWGRHWLDQARYADSNGYTIDGERTMWPYRDWVIQALNEDLPFDRFTVEQLAGDLLPDPTKSQLVATGFHRNTLINQEGGTDDEQFRNEEVVDRVSTTGAVWLGLTLGCAQCHSHKYDPVSQREFYELFAFFNQSEDVNNVGPTVDVAEHELFVDSVAGNLLPLWETALAEVRTLEQSRPQRQAGWEAELRESLRSTATRSPSTPLADAELADAELAAAVATAADQRTAKQVKLLQERFAAQDEELQTAKQRVESLRHEIGLGKTVKAMVMRDRSQPRETYIHVRGDFLSPDQQTGQLLPGVPAILPPLPQTDQPRTRLQLAQWLVRPDHPLTPRVTVNRVWMRYFGRGIVETENDFGTQGAYPTHPDLLDWLAARFRDSGWSLKQLHRLITTSAVYRQSSRVRAELTARDPANKLLGRQNRLRFEAEIIRDAALTASGLLEPRIGGPSVRPPQPEGVYAFTQRKIKWVADQGRDRFRRAMYTQFYRSAPYPLLTTFDSPDFQAVCTARSRSNTPLQSLVMANDASLFELAQGLALRLMREVVGQGPPARRRRIERAFLICLARLPSAAELLALDRFQQLQVESFAGSDSSAAKVAPAGYPESYCVAAAASWTAVARGLMNTDEFITRE